MKRGVLVLSLFLISVLVISGCVELSPLKEDEDKYVRDYSLFYQDYIDGCKGVDTTIGLSMDTTGPILIVGETTYSEQIPYHDVCLIELDSDFEYLNTYTLELGPFIPQASSFHAESIDWLESGGYIIGGYYIDSTNLDKMPILIKLDSDFNLIDNNVGIGYDLADSLLPILPVFRINDLNQDYYPGGSYEVMDTMECQELCTNSFGADDESCPEFCYVWIPGDLASSHLLTLYDEQYSPISKVANIYFNDWQRFIDPALPPTEMDGISFFLPGPCLIDDLDDVFAGSCEVPIEGLKNEYIHQKSSEESADGNFYFDTYVQIGTGKNPFNCETYSETSECLDDPEGFGNCFLDNEGSCYNYGCDLILNDWELCSESNPYCEWISEDECMGELHDEFCDGNCIVCEEIDPTTGESVCNDCGICDFGDSLGSSPFIDLDPEFSSNMIYLSEKVLEMNKYDPLIYDLISGNINFYNPADYQYPNMVHNYHNLTVEITDNGWYIVSGSLTSVSLDPDIMPFYGYIFYNGMFIMTLNDNYGFDSFNSFYLNNPPTNPPTLGEIMGYYVDISSLEQSIFSQDYIFTLKEHSYGLPSQIKSLFLKTNNEGIPILVHDLEELTNDLGYYNSYPFFANEINSNQEFLLLFTTEEEGIACSTLDCRGTLILKLGVEDESLGCMDNDACNYDTYANIHGPNLCIYPPDFGFNCEGVCDHELCGCTNPDANNYDSLASVNDGTCEFEESICTVFNLEPVISFCNSQIEVVNICTTYCEFIHEYNPDASCFESIDSYCENNIFNDALNEFEGSARCCLSEEIVGCMDNDACNYDADVNILDGSCQYPDFGFNCEGVCDHELCGCTNPDANNYDSTAIVNDGTCEYEMDYCQWVSPFEDYICSSQEDAQAICYNSFQCTILDPSTGEYVCFNILDSYCDNCTYDYALDTFKGITGCCINYPPYTGPCTSNDICGPTYYCSFDQCGDQEGECESRGWGCPTVYDPVCGCDGTTYGNSCEAALAGVSVGYEGECVPPGSVLGCTNPNSCNYDPDATFDDGSCAPEGSDFCGCPTYDGDSTTYYCNYWCINNPSDCVSSTGEVCNIGDFPFQWIDHPFDCTPTIPIYDDGSCESWADGNEDGLLNVLDVVALVNCVLDQNCEGCAVDINGDDGYNVLDIVALVNCVLCPSCAGCSF